MKYLLIAVFLVIGFNFILNSQNSYRFIHEFARLVRYDNKYVNGGCKFNKYNRTYSAFGCNFTTYKDITLNNDIYIHAKAFIFKSNEYKQSFFDMPLPLCPLLKSVDMFDIVNILKYSNVTKCPIKKGTYYIKNISPEASQFPPHLIPGKWRLDLHFMWDDIEVLFIEWMTTIEYTVKH